MRCLKLFLLIIIAIPLLNILLITVCNESIKGSWWKYSRGANFKDVLEFDQNLQANSILIQKDSKTEKIIFLYFFDYMILADQDLTNWTYYVRKGKKYDPDNTEKPPQKWTKITVTPRDTLIKDSLISKKIR